MEVLGRLRLIPCPRVGRSDSHHLLTVSGNGRITVSPDGNWVAFPYLEGLGADLILVENFRR